MAKVKKYIPRKEARPNWNIKEMSKEEREKLKENLVIALIDNEEDYQKVIGYMYKKYPFAMDGVKDPDTGKTDVSIQWNYSVAKNKQMVFNNKTNKWQDMYAFVIYDKERDMEPICFAGSYFKLGNAVDVSDLNKKYLMKGNGELDKNGHYQAFGNGYVLFVDPNYRRLGLGSDTWWAEAQLYREALNIRYQREIQNEYSLKSTQAMFSDPSKCIITSPGRLKNDGTRCQIRCLLDYEDKYLEECFNKMPEGLKQIYSKPDFTFLEKELHRDENELNEQCNGIGKQLTLKDILNPWNGGK